jgi:MFS family permease
MMSTHRPTTTRPFGLVVAVFLIIELTPIFEVTMMSTALPTLITAFGVDTSTISWVLTVFLLVGAATAAIAGRLGDAYGRKRVLIVLMVVSAVGSVVSVVTGNFAGVLVGRALQGTSAGLFPLLIGLAREVVPAPRVALLASLTSGVSVIGGAFGALAAGVLLQTSGWHSMFVASAVLAIIAILVALILPAPVVTRRSRGRFDVLGAVLMAPAIAAVLFGFTASRTAGASPFVIGLVAGGAVLLAFWVLWELRTTSPMFNLRIFRDRSLVLTLAATALSAVGIMSAPQLLTPMLQQSPTSLPVGLGLTPTEAGLYGLISGVLSFALSPIAGRFAGRHGAKRVLVVGIALGVVGYAGFLIAVHSVPLATAAVVVGSIGTAFVVVGVPLVIVERVAVDDTSEAVGLIFTVGRTVFSAVGTAVAGVLLASDTVTGTTAPTSGAWSAAVLFVLITGAGAIVATLLIGRIVPLGRRGSVNEAVVEAQKAHAAADR